MFVSSDLTFITNEQGKHPGDPLGFLLAEDARLDICSVRHTQLVRAGSKLN